MNCCILVASHIRYTGQLELLKECLTSLLEQTYKADIYVSISFENDTFNTLFRNNILPLFTDVEFLIQNQQKYQLEHLKYLCIRICSLKKYKWVFFCDDDDKYTPDRVETFVKYIQCHNDIKLSIIKEKGVYEGIKKGSPILIYWLYVVKPELLLYFFDKIIKNNKLLKNNNADYLLKAYFERCHNKKDTINDELYLYYQYNKNSVYNNEKEYLKILYYNVINFNEDTDNTYKLNLKTNKPEPLTKKDYIKLVPHYHHLKETIKSFYKFDMLKYEYNI